MEHKLSDHSVSHLQKSLTIYIYTTILVHVFFVFWQSFTKIKDPIKSTSKIFLCFLFFFDSFLGNQTESEESRESVRLWKRSVMMSEKKKKSNFTRRPKKNEKIYLNSELSSWPINSVMRETVKVRKCRGVRQRKKKREREELSRYHLIFATWQFRAVRHDFFIFFVWWDKTEWAEGTKIVGPILGALSLCFENLKIVFIPM